MRVGTLLAGFVLAGAAYGGQEARPILLIPVDDRPATVQFPAMIGEIAGSRVVTPPAEMLGRFTKPGNPEGILAWLAAQDLGRYRTIIVSTDMIAYGGLIHSRQHETRYDEAIRRLRAFQKIRRAAKGTRVYGFSTIMRLTPTATRRTAAWRIELGRYAEVKARYRLTRKPDLLQTLRNLEAKIPALEIQRYEFSRDRNHRVQQELVRMAGANVFDYLIFGQDDAQPTGPHIAETKRLMEMATNLHVTRTVDFCMGIDQHANVLTSRALLADAGWSPKVRVIYADPLGRDKIAAYESTPVEQSLGDQLRASGAQLGSDEDFDYTLFVNTPEPRELQFEAFLGQLKTEVDQGFPVAVADINLGKTGTGDPNLFDALTAGSRAIKLIAYSGWNTAGNTMGTAIPAANVYLLARRTGAPPLDREKNQRAFLLHRLVNDFQYHRFTRPMAFAMIDANPRASREETPGEELQAIDDFVKDDLQRRLEETFHDQFFGRKFFAGPKQYVFRGLDQVSVQLPWPRAYEVRLEFRLVASELGG